MLAFSIQVLLNSPVRRWEGRACKSNVSSARLRDDSVHSVLFDPIGMIIGYYTKGYFRGSNFMVKKKCSNIIVVSRFTMSYAGVHSLQRLLRYAWYIYHEFAYLGYEIITRHLYQLE